MSTESFSQQKFVAVPGRGWLSWTRSPLAWMEQALAAWPSASVARVPRGFRRQEAARGSQSLPTQLHNARCLRCLHQPSSWLIARCFPAPHTGHHLPPDGWPDRSASSSNPPLPPHGHSPLSGRFVLSQGHSSESRRAARTCSLALHQAAHPPTQDRPLPCHLFLQPSPLSLEHPATPRPPPGAPGRTHQKAGSKIQRCCQH